MNKKLFLLAVLIIFFTLSSKVYMSSTEEIIKKASHVVIAEIVEVSHKGRYKYFKECTRIYKWILAPKKNLKGQELSQKRYNFYYMVLLSDRGPCPRLYFRTPPKAEGYGHKPEKGTRVIAAMKRNRKGTMIIIGTFSMKNLDEIKRIIRK